jgi:hypothetical protein
MSQEKGGGKVRNVRENGGEEEVRNKGKSKSQPHSIRRFPGIARLSLRGVEGVICLKHWLEAGLSAFWLSDRK